MYFQSLIGRLATSRNSTISEFLPNFQSLIGRLATPEVEAPDVCDSCFQSLIGRLATVLEGLEALGDARLSIPHR